MGSVEEIYLELYQLRERLRRENVYKNGRLPDICSDDALIEITQRLPVRADDFSAIVGLGPKFVDSYAPEFIVITKKYASVQSNGSSMDRRSATTLRELEKKLINISKGNRLLFQAKLLRRNGFDMAAVAGFDFEGLLFGRKRAMKLCDSTDGKEGAAAFSILSSIMREVNRDQREKGQYDLYIGYPFVEGRLQSEDFDIRAPLVLFPVKLEKDTTRINVTRDDSRDPVYNSTLVLANIKFNKTNRSLPSCVIEDTDERTFWESMLQFYREEGLAIKGEEGADILPFRNYLMGEFPKYGPGEMHTVQSMVLGKYPTYSSSIQRDIEGLVAKNEINGILNDLIVDLDNADFYADSPEPMSAEELRSRGISASESDLLYINSLNSAQENVLTAIKKNDELVVQGPPGTGKSQVITGLITSAVNDGKTVLMVSEKKTALDVVYSRMGNLNRYCLLIDDVANKDLFYGQLDKMLSSSERPAGILDLDPVSASIDNDVTILDRIADCMYAPGEFGIEPYKMYAMDEKVDLSNKSAFDAYRAVKEGVPPRLLSLKYDDVVKLHEKYSDSNLISNLKDYGDCLSRSPWLGMMKLNLSDYNIGEMKADLMDLEMQMIDYNSKGFLSRLFSKGKVQREATAMLDKYFDNYSQKLVASVLDDPKSMVSGLNSYSMYSSRATVYRRLTPDEKVYGESLMSMKSRLDMPYARTNDLVLDHIISEHLRSFDSSNKSLLQQMQDFDSIIQDMDRKITQKRDQSKARVEQILEEDLRYITESKRKGDIMRVVDSKRRWSLNKFINRYGFELFKGIKIWLLTPEVVSEILPLEMGLFDLLIFDEASQMYVEKGIPSIYRAKKVVVAGDHKQLRPSSLGSGRIEYDDEEAEEELMLPAALEEESLLDLARARYDSILLNFHYRSKYEELIAFSNYAFYKGRLYVSPNIAQPERPPIEMHMVDGVWMNKTNTAEAKEIIRLLKEFFATRKGDETVGIITFNIAQRDHINDLLDEECSKDPKFASVVNEEMNRTENGEDIGLFIKNIESVQGDERDVIMFSVGYAKNSDGKLMQRFGWLNNQGGENRLNVAISRSKRKIHIVTSFDPSELKVDDAKNDGPRILKKYLQYAKAVSDGNKELEKIILMSFGDDTAVRSESSGTDAVKDKVYDALVARGYSVEKDVGIGGYSIDLAIKQDCKYILGIECDGRLYAMSTNSRERDYHRQKYLESRGWRIHRVWTPGLWKDPDAEINRIVASIAKK
jgi:very-short-patch-repair endonuclease